MLGAREANKADALNLSRHIEKYGQKMLCKLPPSNPKAHAFHNGRMEVLEQIRAEFYVHDMYALTPVSRMQFECVYTDTPTAREFFWVPSC